VEKQSFLSVVSISACSAKGLIQKTGYEHVSFTYFLFLRTFEKLRKATLKFVIAVCASVRPSVHMEQLGSHWTVFHEI